MSLLLLVLTTEMKPSFHAVWTEKDFVGEILQNESCLTIGRSRRYRLLSTIKTETSTGTIGREAIEHLAIRKVNEYGSCYQ
jgi:hypothetical protein